MKKILLVLIVFLSVYGIGFAEGLNSDANMLKDKIPGAYDSIKSRAVEEWGTDHNMIVYTINKQVTALFDLLPYVEDHATITLTAMIEWCEGGSYTLDSYIDNDKLLEAPVDWSMALYITEKQIKAQAAY